MTAPMTSREALLPCPFCGGPAKMTRFPSRVSPPQNVEITQIQCDNDEYCHVCVDIQHINEAVAVKAWNRRAGVAQSSGPWPKEEIEPGRWVDVDPDVIARPWPPLKKALWNVLMAENLNDGHYIKAFHLIEKLWAAASPVSSTDRREGGK